MDPWKRGALRNSSFSDTWKAIGTPDILEVLEFLDWCLKPLQGLETKGHLNLNALVSTPEIPRPLETWNP